MAKITIYTKTFNRAHMLPRAIESVLSQSFTDYEYIIHDNGSTDETQSVIQFYAKQDSRIKCIRNKENVRGGEPDDPLYISSGENMYFTQVDDDDWIDKDEVGTLYHLAKDSGSDIVTVGSRYAFPDGSLTDKYVFDGQYTFNRVDAMYELLKREKVNSAKGGKMYRKDIMFQIDFPAIRPIRDIHREYRVFNRISNLTVTGVPMYYFYRHNNNVSGLENKMQITPGKMNEHLLANRIRTKYLAEKMPEIADFALYSEYSFMISLTDRIRKLPVEDCFSIAEQMADTLRKNTEWLMACGYLKPHEIEILNTL